MQEINDDLRLDDLPDKPIPQRVKVEQQRAYIAAMRGFAKALLDQREVARIRMVEGANYKIPYVPGIWEETSHFPEWANLLKAQADAAENDLHDALYHLGMQRRAILQAQLGGRIVEPGRRQ